MTREPSGDPLFSNQLAAFYVRQNTPQMLEYGHKVENDMAFLLMSINNRVKDLIGGTRTPSIPGQYDLVEIQSPFTHCTYRVVLYFVDKRWVIGGSGLTGRYFLFFQKLAKVHTTGESYDELVKSSFDSTSQYARFFSRLVELHPMIGLTNMLFLDYAKKHRVECLSWYESAVKHAQAILLTLEGIEDSVQERTTLPIVKEFIADFRKELELLLIDCMNLAFLQAHNQGFTLSSGVLDINDVSSKVERGLKKDGIINSHFRFDAQGDHQRTHYLKKIQEFYSKHSKYFSWVNIKGIGGSYAATEKLAEETGSIAVPFYTKGSDITKFLRFLETYTKAIKYALDGKSQIMSRDGDYEIKFRNGIHALFRGIEDTMVDLEIGRAQARISFKYEGVKIRLDRDIKRGKVILDFGEADLGELLEMAHMLITGYEHDPINPPSLMDTRLQYSDPVKKTDAKEIQMRARVALMASAVMSLTQASFPHRNESLASYHSSDHIAKQFYFDQFPQIAEEFERMFRGK